MQLYRFKNNSEKERIVYVGEFDNLIVDIKNKIVFKMDYLNLDILEKIELNELEDVDDRYIYLILKYYNININFDYIQETKDSGIGEVYQNFSDEKIFIDLSKKGEIFFKSDDRFYMVDYIYTYIYTLFYFDSIKLNGYESKNMDIISINRRVNTHQNFLTYDSKNLDYYKTVTGLFIKKHI